MKRKTRNLLLGAAGILLLSGAVAAGILYRYLFSSPFRIEEKTYIYIDRDDTVDSVYHKIELAALPRTMKGFRKLAEHYRYDRRIRTGKYEINPGDAPYYLYKRLAAGVQVPVLLTINAVRTKENLARMVASQLMIDSTEIVAPLYDPEFCSARGYTPETILCMILPNTYEVYWNSSAEAFFDRMQKEHNRFWNQTRLEKARAIGLTPVEVSILASIVDEETNVNEEKPVVAGLYLNRLKRGMLLQADPTVKFGLQDFGLRRITNEHLLHDSPYNTYRYAGLPPGPIRIPTIQGIESVLNYTEHNFLYMCAKEDFSGRHNFAVTLAQHTANARRYHDALNKRRIFR